MKLSKKYGLNPTMCICLYCEKETGEIALLGDNYKGEAPKHMVTSLEPCKDCKAKFEGTHVFVAISEKGIPTGAWVAVKDDALKPAFRAKPMVIATSEKNFNKEFNDTLNKNNNSNSDII